MASNRAATLIVRAAATGLVDFSKAKLLERKWWLRLQILLDELETRDTIDLAKQAFLFHLFTAANSGFTDETITSARKSAHKLFKKIDNWLRPWVNEADSSNALHALYERYIGSMRDPEHAKAVHDEVAMMHAQVAEAKEERLKAQQREVDLFAQRQARQQQNKRRGKYASKHRSH